MKRFLACYDSFRFEGKVFGYSTNFFLFLKVYFWDGIYDEDL